MSSCEDGQMEGQELLMLTRWTVRLPQIPWECGVAVAHPRSVKESTARDRPSPPWRHPSNDPLRNHREQAAEATGPARTSEWPVGMASTVLSCTNVAIFILSMNESCPQSPWFNTISLEAVAVLPLCPK